MNTGFQAFCCDFRTSENVFRVDQIHHPLLPESRRTIKSASLQRPRIEDLRVECKILHVAGNYGETVALGGGHEQAVHHRQALSGQFRACGDLCPGVECGGIERQDASGEALL